MVTDIIFDLGGVLLNLDMQSVATACKRIGIDPSLFFVKTDEQNTSTVCQGLSAGKAITAYQTGDMTSDDFLQLVQSHCGKDVSRQDIIEAWNSCIGDLPQHRLDLIKELRRRGYATHLLSNTNDLHWEEIKRRFFSREGYTCRDLFDGVFVSHEMHLSKPDRAIYTVAAQRIGTPVEQCYFIDDAEANVEGALRAGMQAAWLDVRKPNALADIIEKIG